MPTFFEKFRTVVTSLTLFLFPLLFLPITTEYYATNKQYLIILCAILLVASAAVGLIGHRKISREIRMFDIPVLLFVVAVGLSTLLTSTNKPAALMNSATGLVTILGLTVIYFFVSREKHEDSLDSYVSILQYTVTIVCIIELAVFILPYIGVTLPQNAALFSSPQFTTLGSVLDLVAFLGFFFVYTGIRMCISIVNRRPNVSEAVSFLFVTLALIFASITFFNIPKTDLPYAPFSYSARAIPVILKSPINALFGYGIDNFSAAFTLAKDQAYAQTPYASISSFSFARSALIHLLIETGIVGVAALLIMFLRGIYESVSLPREVRMAALGLFLYLFMAFLVFPVSIVLLFLLFITLGLLHHDIVAHSTKYTEKRYFKNIRVHPAFSSFGTFVILGARSWGSYLLVQHYRADVSFRHSVASINSRSISETYADQYNAIVLNPYSEKYHISFAQTNLYLANQIALNTQALGQKSLSQKDQETVTNAIKTAIEESRAATVLNPQKATNWENRGKVYKSLLGVAERADVIAIANYERASILDPYNPVYKNELGEIYYLTKQYKQAQKLFEIALAIKPDYTNARYNLAWTLYQAGNQQEAIDIMQRVVDSFEGSDSPRAQRARADLERFKSARTDTVLK